MRLTRARAPRPRAQVYDHVAAHERAAAMESDFRAMDRDGSNALEIYEFMQFFAYLAPQVEQLRRAHAAAENAFRVYDSVGKGFLVRDEFAAAIVALGYVHARSAEGAAAECNRAFVNCDANCDGKLSREEFVAAIDGMAVRARAQRDVDGKAAKLFAELAGGQRHITKESFWAGVARLGMLQGLSVPQAQAKVFETFALADQDRKCVLRVGLRGAARAGLAREPRAGCPADACKLRCVPRAARGSGTLDEEEFKRYYELMNAVHPLR